MALSNSLNPSFVGLHMVPQEVTADDSASTLNTVEAGRVVVEVTGVTNDANDFIVLPSLADVYVGHQIRVINNAGSNFEIRTPASSNEKINTVDSDGTQEYLAVDAEIVILTKVSDTDGWAAIDVPALGGAGTATVPD